MGNIHVTITAFKNQEHRLPGCSLFSQGRRFSNHFHKKSLEFIRDVLEDCEAETINFAPHDQDIKSFAAEDETHVVRYSHVRCPNNDDEVELHGDDDDHPDDVVVVEVKLWIILNT